MGCDIHMYVECRDRFKDEVSQWRNCDHWKLNKYYENDEDSYEQKYKVVGIYDDRDYFLFSVLADVRNYSDIPFICQPKGLPMDCTDVVKEISDIWNGDGHSHSFLTLAEIKKFNHLHKKYKRSGYVPKKEAQKLDDGIEPDHWCQWTNQEGYEYREWETSYNPLDGLILALEKRMKEEFYIYRDKYDKIIEEDIRIVFWFDN